MFRYTIERGQNELCGTLVKVGGNIRGQLDNDSPFAIDKPLDLNAEVVPDFYKLNTAVYLTPSGLL